MEKLELSPEEIRKMGKKWGDLILSGMSFDEVRARYRSADRPNGLTIEDCLKGLSPEEVMSMYKPEERLKGLSIEDCLKGLTTEDCLKGLTTEDRLKGIPIEEIEAYFLKMKKKGRKKHT
ncbi:MAG: hypothetical protein AB7S75_16945 [Desulfococcaceae bacterium]